MKTIALLLILTVLGNGQVIKQGTHTSYQDRCPANICHCETVPDSVDPTVFYMMATCTAMPPRLDNSIRYLKVTGEIDRITKNMITALGTSLRKLDLSNCKIREIEKKAFSSVNLKYLILSHNKLTELQEDIFHCMDLEELYLDGNDILNIHYNTFQDLKKLKSLYLQHNMMQNCSFKLSDTLSHLDFHDNEIGSFNLSLTKVNYLDLCGNRLQEFPLKNAIRNVNLISLCLSDKASNLPGQFASKFPAISNLTLEGSTQSQMELDGNTQYEIGRLTDITILSIEYFSIKSLNFISNKRTLVTLVLKNIKLDNKDSVQEAFRTLSFLEFLSIDDSPDLLKPLLGEGSVISQLTRLRYLSVQNTNLISITRHNIPPNVNRLNIANNPLRCDCKLSWIVKQQKDSAGGYLKDVANTICNKPPKFDQQLLVSVVNPPECTGNSDGMLEQERMVTNSTSMEQDMMQSDHTVLYIVLGSCLLVLVVIGIILIIVLSIMKKRRKVQIAPEGGETQMQQQQEIKKASSHDILLKK